MSDEIQIAKKFKPLFQLLNDDFHPEVDVVVLTGGRFSTKSFNVSLLSLMGTVERDWKVLYSRFTNQSIGDSIYLEVEEKIEILNYEDEVNATRNRIESNNGEGFISFKGIKTGSKGQTANLKSLSGFNCFVVDEAEEIPSYETFKKVYYSIRSNTRRNISILILNPTTKEHWIYKELFAKKKIEDGFCGVVDNVMYIHSSYLDIDKKIIPPNILADYKRMKEEEPVEYNNIILGGWITELPGSVFPLRSLQRFSGEIDKEEAQGVAGFIDVADTGSDSHSIPIGYLFGNKIYIDDVLFTTEGTETNVDLSAAIINKHKCNHVRVESNFGGSMYKQLLSPKVNEETMLLPVRAKSNKHARILTVSSLIKNYFVFRDDYEHGSDYWKFMQGLTSYNKDHTLNEHDDAPDSLHGLCVLFKSFYNLWSEHKEVIES